MLTKLYIKNFTIIDTLDINFHAGFSVITGETGAGKSIILGAIGLLLGQRADSKVIKTGSDRCVIEAHFDLSKYDFRTFFDDNDLEYDPDDCIIRRELTTNGKSRSFVNDTPVSLTILKVLGDKLVDVHSQHQNLLLQKDDFQLEVVDIIACDQDNLLSYRNTYEKLKETKKQEETVRQKINTDKDNRDYIQFQYDELEKAALVEGEQERLEQQSETMNHAEEIKNALFETGNALSSDDNGVIDNLKRAGTILQGIEKVYPEISELVQRLNSSYIEVKDIAEEIDTRSEQTDYDPKELDLINEKLDTIYSLQQKHHLDTVEELIRLRDSFKSQLEDIENSDDILLDIEKRVAELEAECKKKATALTAQRRKAAVTIEKEILSRLETLGLTKVRFKINIDETPFNNNGTDKISFLFSANPGTPLQPVSEVASGGEIARLMLSLKAMISGAVKLPTIIFDEIDTGVSGNIAEKMAKIMQEMAKNDRQVISITHLPQIAALGSVHYKVYKEQTDTGTNSMMKELTHEERIKEIAQMLSGSTLTDAALQNAKELLNQI